MLSITPMAVAALPVSPKPGSSAPPEPVGIVVVVVAVVGVVVDVVVDVVVVDGLVVVVVEVVVVVLVVDVVVVDGLVVVVVEVVGVVVLVVLVDVVVVIVVVFTVKTPDVTTFPIGVLTEIGPVVAPAGTVALITLSFTTVKVVTLVPLNLTFVAFVNHFPTTVTVLPTSPFFGAKLLIIGGSSVKLVAETAVPIGVLTEIGPVVAPTGTMALITALFTTVNVVAFTPLNRTAVAPRKPLPTIITVVP